MQSRQWLRLSVMYQFHIAHRDAHHHTWQEMPLCISPSLSYITIIIDIVCSFVAGAQQPTWQIGTWRPTPLLDYLVPLMRLCSSPVVTNQMCSMQHYLYHVRTSIKPQLMASVSAHDDCLGLLSWMILCVYVFHNVAWLQVTKQKKQRRQKQWKILIQLNMKLISRSRKWQSTLF